MKPQDSLRESADVFEERAKIYGMTYLRFGPVMAALFPNGVGAFNAHDMNRLAMVVQIVSKLVRYAGTFSTGGHDDSLLDLSTYAAMLRGLDADGRRMKELEAAAEKDLAEALRNGGPFVPQAGFPRGDCGPAVGVSRRTRLAAWKAEVEIEPSKPEVEKMWSDAQRQAPAGLEPQPDLPDDPDLDFAGGRP